MGINMKIKKLLAFHPIYYLFLLGLTSLIYTIINQSGTDAVDVTIKIDSYIPFVEEFVVPYLLWYPFIYGALIYYCFVDRKQYYVGLGSMIAGKIICFIVYIFWQSTVPRPAVVGEDLFAHLMRHVYSHDQPVNCLPSIHVLTTFIIMMIAIKRKDANKWEVPLVSIIGSMIILSTLFTKQHAILDVLAGIVLAIAMYAVFQWILYPALRKQTIRWRGIRIRGQVKVQKK